MCGHTYQPVAALLKDLKQRGLLDSSLVIWGGEFGRLPISQSGNGRDRNPHGFTMGFAGGGTKGGQAIGETDELGLRGIGDRYAMRDFHATILQLLGMDQNQRLTTWGLELVESWAARLIVSIFHREQSAKIQMSGGQLRREQSVLGRLDRQLAHCRDVHVD
jgi:hypothetical protein